MWGCFGWRERPVNENSREFQIRESVRENIVKRNPPFFTLQLQQIIKKKTLFCETMKI